MHKRKENRNGEGNVSVETQACSLSIQEAEARRSQHVHSLPGVDSMCQANANPRKRSCFKNQTKKQKNTDSHGIKSRKQNGQR